MKQKKVVFLDRDGVINRKLESDYIKRWDEFRFVNGAIDACKLLTQKGYEIIVVTNQAGIAKGFMNKADLDDIHANMQEELGRHGVKIKAIYHCPHHEEDNCECRKPQPGMLLQAAKDHNINLAKAVFIGDRETDEQAGKAAGCKTIRIEEGKLLQAVQSLLA